MAHNSLWLKCLLSIYFHSFLLDSVIYFLIRSLADEYRIFANIFFPVVGIKAVAKIFAIIINEKKSGHLNECLCMYVFFPSLHFALMHIYYLCNFIEFWEKLIQIKFAITSWKFSASHWNHLNLRHATIRMFPLILLSFEFLLKFNEFISKNTFAWKQMRNLYIGSFECLSTNPRSTWNTRSLETFNYLFF